MTQKVLCCGVACAVACRLLKRKWSTWAVPLLAPHWSWRFSMKDRLLSKAGLKLSWTIKTFHGGFFKGLKLYQVFLGTWRQRKVYKFFPSPKKHTPNTPLTEGVSSPLMRQNPKNGANLVREFSHFMASNLASQLARCTKFRWFLQRWEPTTFTPLFRSFQTAKTAPQPQLFP